MRWIIVTGLPATGKSTLARQLAARYQLPVLAKDHFKEQLLDAAGTVDAARSRQLSNISFARLFTQLRQLADGGADALLEGNFRVGEHEAPLRALPTARVAQVLCRSGEDVRQARITARRGDPARHPGHGDGWAARDASNDSFLHLPGEQFVLETGVSATGNLDILLRKLDGWWRAGAVR